MKERGKKGGVRVTPFEELPQIRKAKIVLKRECVYPEVIRLR